MAAFPRLAVDAGPVVVVAILTRPTMGAPTRALFLGRWRDAMFEGPFGRSPGTDQVCGAKQRQGRAVYPAPEQQGGHPLSVPLSGVRVRRAKEINQPVRPSSLFRRKKKVSVWALVLSEHLYPGSPRIQAVAHVRYRRLTLMEREEISRLLAVGHSLSFQLRSTSRREIRRRDLHDISCVVHQKHHFLAWM